MQYRLVYGFARKAEIDRIEAFINKGRKFGFYPPEGTSFEAIVQKLDNTLFRSVLIITATMF